MLESGIYCRCKYLFTNVTKWFIVKMNHFGLKAFEIKLITYAIFVSVIIEGL